MTEEQKKTIAAIFQRNLDNRLSIDLCNGMLQVIFEVIEKEGDGNGNTNLSDKTGQ